MRCTLRPHGGRADAGGRPGTARALEASRDPRTDRRAQPAPTRKTGQPISVRQAVGSELSAGPTR